MSASLDSVTAQLATASLTAASQQQPNAAENEAVLASAAEGRRLYIGNLAYATTEGELKDFFKDYLV
jgi:RNA recognition motif-containing protein